MTHEVSQNPWSGWGHMVAWNWNYTSPASSQQTWPNKKVLVNEPKAEVSHGNFEEFSMNSTRCASSPSFPLSSFLLAGKPTWQIKFEHLEPQAAPSQLGLREHDKNRLGCCYGALTSICTSVLSQPWTASCWTSFTWERSKLNSLEVTVALF